jgi:hypothetical protein
MGWKTFRDTAAPDGGSRPDFTEKEQQQRDGKERLLQKVDCTTAPQQRLARKTGWTSETVV